MNRRDFIGSVACAAGLSSVNPVWAGRPNLEDRRWAFLVHFGFNSWYDWPLTEAPIGASAHFRTRCLADHVRMDRLMWQELSLLLPKAGVNCVVVDLGEIMQFPSHPELAVKGSWSPDAMREEKRRLESLGLEVIPKLNFSAAHDSWLKEYHRMLSTQTYYRVCEDIIRDVVEVFGNPRYFHLGFDEETAQHQSPERYRFAAVRQGDLWWYDFLFLAGCVEKLGVRPWVWSDYVWHHESEFLKRMPRSVLQSNWYYSGFDGLPPGGEAETYVRAYDKLDKAGFDQIPTGSNCEEGYPRNMEETVRYCNTAVSSGRLKGFLMASWARLQRAEEPRFRAGIEALGRARKLYDDVKAKA